MYTNTHTHTHTHILHAGAGKPISARRVSYLSVGSCACITATASIILYLFRRRWAEIFTKDEAVVAEITRVMPVQISFLVMDAVQGACDTYTYVCVHVYVHVYMSSS